MRLFLVGVDFTLSRNNPERNLSSPSRIFFFWLLLPFNDSRGHRGNRYFLLVVSSRDFSAAEWDSPDVRRSHSIRLRLPSLQLTGIDFH
ncbi:hypothetical protein R1flu_020172 [Riccia fluitans]|uniref:Uncharacterized protein n=1 Tax=Riccia fluitans TaxID=41844 RepID=A0ABD1ZPA5_9MARC